MRLLILALLGLLSLSTPQALKADQIIQGRITSNTVWEAGAGPYYVLGKVVVEKGAVLTLRPGTQVRFVNISSDPSNASGFVVRGAINGQGTEAKPVYFTALHHGEKWGQIYFTNLEEIPSSLAHCVIAGGRVVCAGSRVSINQCSLTGARNALVVAPGSTPRIVGNHISGNTIGLTFLGEASGCVVAANSIYGNDYGVCAEKFRDGMMAANRVYANRVSNVIDPSEGPMTVSSARFKTSDRLN